MFDFLFSDLTLCKEVKMFIEEYSDSELIEWMPVACHFIKWFDFGQIETFFCKS